MTGEFQKPDRFGCGAVAMALFLTLFLLLLILLVLASNPDFRQTIQNFLNGQQQQQNSGPGNGAVNAPVPDISDRYFSTGSVQSTVTGDLTFNLSNLALDDVRSYVNDNLAWIAFGGNGPTTVLVSFHEPENSVAISDGQHTALGVDAQCAFNVTVTDALVSGHVSCAHAQALDGGTQVGTTAIELDFSAATAPGDGGSDPGGGDTTPTDAP